MEILSISFMNCDKSNTVIDSNLIIVNICKHLWQSTTAHDSPKKIVIIYQELFRTTRQDFIDTHHNITQGRTVHIRYRVVTVNSCRHLSETCSTKQVKNHGSSWDGQCYFWFIVKVTKVNEQLGLHFFFEEVYIF